MTDYPNWFEQIAKDNFEKFLTPLQGEIRLRFLQLGVFTGDASVWLCKNILTSQISFLDDVDTWKGAANEPIQEQMDFEDVYNTYLAKTAEYERTITVHRRDTSLYLIDDRTRTREYDFIYVDAHHTSASAFLDCELSWPLLKSGGMMAIDDYEWLHPDGLEIHAPKLGINMFLDRHPDEYETLIINQQYWLKKK